MPGALVPASEQGQAAGVPTPATGSLLAQASTELHARTRKKPDRAQMSATRLRSDRPRGPV